MHARKEIIFLLFSSSKLPGQYNFSRCITINVFYCNSISDLSVSCDNITPFKLTFWYFISLSLKARWRQSLLLVSFHCCSRQFYLKDHLLQTQLLRKKYPGCLWSRCQMETATITTIMINIIIIIIIMPMMGAGECQVTGWLGWWAGMRILTISGDSSNWGSDISWDYPFITSTWGKIGNMVFRKVEWLKLWVADDSISMKLSVLLK